MNKEVYWFKNKKHGGGWTPSNRSGWIVTIIFVVFFIAQTSYLGVLNDSRLNYYNSIKIYLSFGLYLFNITCAVLALFVIVKLKGEKLKSFWTKDGKKDKLDES